MCGIAGILAASELPDASVLSDMLNRLEHRGPDAQGVHSAGPAALGHRRLSIIDLSGGGQPMSNSRGDLTVVFNGEIYNFLELRAALEQSGAAMARGLSRYLGITCLKRVGYCPINRAR